MEADPKAHALARGKRGHPIPVAVKAWLRTQGPWLLLCLAIGVAISLIHGQSNWWDLRNYHIYNPWSLLHHREATDLFVAGIQSYFSPYADVPYYLLSMAWLPGYPRVVAAFAGLPFGALIYMTILLVRTILADFQFSRSMERHLITAITVIVAVTGASTWSQAISTSHGVALGILVMGAMLILLSAFGSSSRGLTMGKAMAIGALLGFAAGMKLTTAFYAPAGGLILLVGCRNWREALRCGSAFFLGWICLFLVSWGPWAWHLYEVTGDPFFPMFNNVFQSPYAAASGGRDLRGMPHGVMQWLFYPLYWLSDTHITVERLYFRDARFAVGYLLGIAILVRALIVRLRRSGGRYHALVALVGFWFIAYGAWLGLFSLIRYAIVLEIGAVVVTTGAIVLFLQAWRPCNRASVRLPVLCAFAIFFLTFAVIPNQGSVPFGARTFEAEAPNLGNDPLVILANQPMGLLAPLVARTNPTTAFVGVPACFVRDGWCNRGFYNHGLGREMRQKVATHQGPIYVAYYINRNPAMSQLAAFGIHFSNLGCTPMRTNRTPTVRLCPAKYDKSLIGAPVQQHRYRLSLKTDIMRLGTTMKGRWEDNPCTNNTTPATLTLKWNAPKSVSGVRLYLHVPPGRQQKLFYRGEPVGSATTGKWARAGQTFVLKDANGQVLAKSRVLYAVCSRLATEPATGA